MMLKIGKLKEKIRKKLSFLQRDIGVFKNWLLITLLNIRHVQGSKKNIMVFSVARGGSTWLTQIIGTQNGMRYIDHAFAYPLMDVFTRKLIPKVYLNTYIKPDTKYLGFLDNIEIGNTLFRTSANPFSKDFNRISERIVYKITKATALIDYLSETGKYQIVYQIRHPIPVSLSRIHLGWGCNTKAYLENDYFREKYLSEKEIDYAYSIVRSEDTLKKYVLNWTLENLVPLKSTNKSNWLIVSYEETIIYAIKTTQFLCEKLSLDDVETMLSRINKPSSSSHFSTRETKKNISKNRRHLISKWKKHISDEEEKACMNILEKFGVDAYQYGFFLPKSKFLNFVQEHDRF